MSKTDYERTFQDAYKQLNDAQKEAVDAIEGPVMVVAGPGTGKTQILTLRIANILLTTDTKPENILALTFTESGARAMRERLKRYIGSSAYRVPMYTFHGFADTLIKEFPEYFSRVIGATPLVDVERISVLESILEGGHYSLIKPMGNPTFYVTPILSQISELKREYVLPDGLAKIITLQESQLTQTAQFHEKGAHKGKVHSEYAALEKNIARNYELLSVYRAYEAILESDRKYDFDDMIISVVTALTEHEEFLLEVQERYQYVLADEHQDVNGSQNKILELLASYHESPNLFVVGDEKQAIYRFQGASLENFLYFEDRFAHTNTISLTENYRSGQTILDVAHTLITTGENTNNDLRIELESKTDVEGKVTHASFSHVGYEHAWLAEEIKKCKSTGKESLWDVAVIVRTNREVKEISSYLASEEIPVVSEAENDALSHPVTQSFVDIVTLLAFPHRDDAWLRVLHSGYVGVSVSDMARIGNARTANTTIVALLHDSQALSECGIEDQAAIVSLVEVIEESKKVSSSLTYSQLIESVVDKIGLKKYVITHDPIEGVQMLKRLFDEVRFLEKDNHALTAQDVLAYLSRLRDYNLSLSVPSVRLGREGVVVLTAHKSKGLEYDHVFIPHLSDGSWGKKKGRAFFNIPLTKHVHDGQHEDDERRLLYVGLTRARVSCMFLYSDKNASQMDQSPSRFLEDLPSDILTHASTDDFVASYSAEKLIPDEYKNAPVFDAELLSTLFFSRPFSVTALNNYRQSPWQYFYRNLLRLPEAQSLHLIYGNTMHECMRRLYAGAKDVSSTSLLRSWLTDILSHAAITEVQYTELHEKGLEALTGYAAQHAAEITKNSKQEFSITVTLDTDDEVVPQIPLTGIIDRVDIGEDGAYTKVVDYKTGKAKTRGQIEGTTKDSDGQYKRQLVFYKLLFTLMGENDSRYAVPENYELVFLEPNKKGEYVTHTFTISDEEVEELRQEIVNVARSIVSGDFLTTKCDDSVCDYCDLVSLLKTESAH